MVRCDTCPYCKDTYPGKLDPQGNHFCICGMTGNMVYTAPRKKNRYSGAGWIRFNTSTCGLFDTVDEALASMTQIERQRYYEKQKV